MVREIINGQPSYKKCTLLIKIYCGENVSLKYACKKKVIVVYLILF